MGTKTEKLTVEDVNYEFVSNELKQVHKIPNLPVINMHLPKISLKKCENLNLRLK